jgi:hypothetical protein
MGVKLPLGEEGLLSRSRFPDRADRSSYQIDTPDQISGLLRPLTRSDQIVPDQIGSLIERTEENLGSGLPKRLNFQSFMTLISKSIISYCLSREIAMRNGCKITEEEQAATFSIIYDDIEKISSILIQKRCRRLGRMTVLPIHITIDS